MAILGTDEPHDTPHDTESFIPDQPVWREIEARAASSSRTGGRSPIRKARRSTLSDDIHAPGATDGASGTVVPVAPQVLPIVDSLGDVSPAARYLTPI